jgi:hypothetical protein
MNRKTIILPRKRFFTASDEDLNIKVQMESNDNLLREGDKDVVIDSDIIFNEERQKCQKYKIYGKLKMIFRNMYSGTTNYTYLKNRLYLVNGTNPRWVGYIPYDEFAFLRRDVIRQKISIPTGQTLSNIIPEIEITGSTDHTVLTQITAPYQNWNLYLTYVYDKVTDYPLKYTLSGNTVFNFTSGSGIPFRVSEYENHYELTSPVEHGMSEGDHVILSGNTDNSEKIYYIESLGNEVYRSEKFVINISKSEIGDGDSLPIVTFGKRCIDINDIPGTTSQYYIHKHKTLTNMKDCVIDNLGFESPIWEDERKIIFENASSENDVVVERNRMESILYDFVNPFVLSGITNNLNYTPTEVYVSVVFRNGNGYFDYPPKVGYKFNFHNNWTDEHFSGDISKEHIEYTTFERGENYVFKSGSPLNVGSDLIGGFIEYIPSEMRERTISESYHKIYNPKGDTPIFDYYQDIQWTNFSGSTPANLLGLYYQTHYKVKLRELSPYTETSNTDDVIGIPENSKFFDTEKEWKWRDIYEHGYIDPDGFGTDYPFINNMHYVKKDINFYLRNEVYYNNKPDGLIGFIDQPINC